MSIAHKGDIIFMVAHKYPNGETGWEQRDGQSHCEYCGSLHPTNVVALIKAGATAHLADRKYGWPHKVYLDNPWGKFYTRHLVDATPAEKAIIEQAIGLIINFDPEQQAVSWGPVTPKGNK